MDSIPKVICLIGGDGSGKTLHAKKLVSELQSQGKKSSYTWFGQPYILAYPFMFLCSKLGYTKLHRLPSRIVFPEHEYYRNKALAFTWPWIQLIDLAVLVLMQVRLPLWRGEIVVCDRFVYDTLVELMADTSDEKLHTKLVGKLITGLKPQSAVVLRLNINPETALNRRDDVPNLKFLTTRRKAYEQISRDFEIKTFNAEQPFEIVHQSIIEYIN